MTYERIHWVSDVTPISADNFNHMEEGIAQACERTVCKHVAKLIGKSENEEYDVYLDFIIYDDSNEAYDSENLQLIFDKQFQVSGIVRKDDAYLRIDAFGMQDNAFFVLFGDSEYGFNIGAFEIEDDIIQVL